MTGHYIRTEARSAAWAWNMAAFAVVLLPMGVGFFRLDLLDFTTLTWALLLAGGLAVIAALSALTAIALVWRNGAIGGRRAVAALLVATIAILPFAGAAYLFRQFPVGASAETAGLEELAGAPSVGEVGSGSSLIPGRDYQATASMVYDAARAAMDRSGIEILDVQTSLTPAPDGDDLGISGTVDIPIPTLRSTLPDEALDRFAVRDASDYTVQAVAYAPVFGFPSDVTVRITEDGSQTFVDMRSASRSLQHDLGQNRRIIEGFLARLDEAMRTAEGIVPEE